MTVDIDYTFLGFGGLYEAIIEATKEACRRFGAKKMECVYLTARDHIRQHGEESLKLEILRECGVEISDEDCEFLKKFVEAEGSVRWAAKLFKELSDENQDQEPTIPGYLE
jgi:hypothetical protein